MSTAVSSERNLEADSISVWVAFSRDQTEALTNSAVTGIACPLHSVLLGAFVHHYCRWKNRTILCVEMESHGRVVFDGAVDVVAGCRVVYVGISGGV